MYFKWRNTQWKIGFIGLDECSGTLMGVRVLRPWKLVEKFWFFIQNDVLLFSHQTSSMKQHLTETHEHLEIFNIVLSSQSRDLRKTPTGFSSISLCERTIKNPCKILYIALIDVFSICVCSRLTLFRCATGRWIRKPLKYLKRLNIFVCVICFRQPYPRLQKARPLTKYRAGGLQHQVSCVASYTHTKANSSGDKGLTTRQNPPRRACVSDMIQTPGCFGKHAVMFWFWGHSRRSYT